MRFVKSLKATLDECVGRSIHFLSVSETRATCFVPSCPVSPMF